MSFTVAAYSNYTKKKNSTKTPTNGQVHQTFQCIMKENCSILYPVIGFDLEGGATNNPYNYNYFYIGVFHRYYFVKDWNWDGGLWWAELSVDTLGTWKASIVSKSEYVVRSGDTSITDISIPDQAYPATFDMVTVSNTVTLYTGYTDNTGTYVMAIADGGESSTGGITYYAGEKGLFGRLFKFLYGSTDWLGGAEITDISNDLLKCLVDPAQYIKSMMWFPFSKEYVVVAQGGLVGAGWWQTNVRLSYTNDVITNTARVTRPYHPQASDAKSYLNFYPYTSMEAFVPAFGKVQLPPEKFEAGKEVVFTVQVDPITGTGNLFIYQSGSNQSSGVVLKGQVGIPVAVTTIVSDVLGAATTLTNSMASGTNSLASAIIGAVGGIADAAKMVSPDVTVTGGNGNLAEYQINGSLTTRFKKIVATDGYHIGFPVCSSKVLGSISGYTVLADPDVDFPCFDEEKDIIQTYMTEGFYLE